MTNDHLQKQWTAAEIESAETVVDPLDAAPAFRLAISTRHGRPSQSIQDGDQAAGILRALEIGNGDAKFGDGYVILCGETDWAYLLTRWAFIGQRQRTGRRLMRGATSGSFVCFTNSTTTGRRMTQAVLSNAKAFFTGRHCLASSPLPMHWSTAKDPITLREWGRRYWENGGWGKRFAPWIATDDIGPYNGLGNGAAMRVSAAGCWQTEQCSGQPSPLQPCVGRRTQSSHRKACVAAATAVAIHLAGQARPSEIRQAITQRFQYDLGVEIWPTYRYNERSQDTAPGADSAPQSL